MTRPAWDFDYAPTKVISLNSLGPEDDWVVATTDDVDPVLLARFLAADLSAVDVTPLLSVPPLHWTRVVARAPLGPAWITARLRSGGIGVRYVAPAHRGIQTIASPLAWNRACPGSPRAWPPRPERSHVETNSLGRWFLGELGVAVNRSICGTGAGMRLAVIDDDAAESQHIGFDAEICVGLEQMPRSSQHAALLAAWAVGGHVTRPGCENWRFAGVAPDASPRLYCIPKPGKGVVELPLAIATAARDGADVVVCATNVEGQWSPMLDDALEFARRAGRGGRGTAVVMPAGRELSSPEGSVHSSLTLCLSDPASDPRVFCVGPSGHGGDWFLWRDRHGKLRPFANRGPALRWLAPGDDMAHPFAPDERFTHAESSGAAGLAAGVILLVLGSNPTLTLAELESVLTRTAEPVVNLQAESCLADPSDLLPNGDDRDGHNARNGYGRLNATRACLLAADPVTAALVCLGEELAALHYARLRREDPRAAGSYSSSFSQFAAVALLKDAALLHTACALTRHARLLSQHPEYRCAHPEGSIGRQIALILRTLLELANNSQRNEAVATEVSQLFEGVAMDLDGYAKPESLLEPRFAALSTALFRSSGTPAGAA